METNRLYRIAEREGVTVDRFSLPYNSSVSVKNGDNLYIGLDSEVSGAEEKVCLAHELGHCVTFSFYNIYSALDIREKHERRAQNWAIKKLIPKASYRKALIAGYDNIYSLAEYFGVTPDFMKKAVEYYKTA
ncbi:MAG: ImmA/IrrE family metallo-endopeptidase [Clostridia bacterium]|nr:ImmA/IrrE family metallo-endopeptidase [Clostridia bacterium]